MRTPSRAREHVVGRRALRDRIARLQARGQRVVFTSGCYDLLHVGHLRSFEQARGLGDALVVGINRDARVRELKGRGRPVVPERQRAELIAGLECVDRVVLFGEDTAAPLIRALRPDVVCKGGDYRGERIPDLRGTYFHTDCVVDTIWSFRLVDGNLTDFRDRTAELQPVGGGLSLVNSFGEDAAGEIYMVTRAGRVFRIVADGLALGDMNGDDSVNQFDIEPFLLALFDPDQYRKRYPKIDPNVTGDINCDKQLDALDIEPFIGLLFD